MSEKQLREIVEAAAYDSMKENNPELLKTVSRLVAYGFTPEQIINLCAEKTNEPHPRLAFIGCAADYIIRYESKVSKTISGTHLGRRIRAKFSSNF